jgi:tetratricopeptide (TPR) repeat protein
MFEATKKRLLGSRAGKKRPNAFPNLAVECLQRWEASVPGPTAQPLLAVRAARRALLESPDDATAWYRLQFAYATLSRSTREREWTFRLPMLSALRQAQRMVALEHAVKLDPDFENAHAALAEEYERLSYPPPRGFLDLALHHRSEQLRVLEANGPARNEAPEEFEARRKRLVDHVESLETDVNKGQDVYEPGEMGKTNMRDKAEFALAWGLGGKARDDLLKSVEATVEREAIPLQLDLMIVTGQIEGEAGIRGALEDAVKESEESGRRPELGQLGQGQFVVPRFEWFQVLVAAASGDYRAADEALEPIIAMREQMHANFLRLGTRFELLDMTPGTLPVRGILPASLVSTQVTPVTLYVSLQHARRLEALRLAAASKPQTADLYALRGLLALEAGDNAHAVKMFRKVLQLDDPGAGPVAKYYLDLLEANGQR